MLLKIPSIPSQSQAHTQISLLLPGWTVRTVNVKEIGTRVGKRKEAVILMSKISNL